MNKDSTKDLVLLSYPNPSPGDVSQYRVPYSLLYLERAIRALGVKILVLDEQLQADYKAILDAHYDRLLLVGVSSLTGDQIQGGIAFSKMVREKGIAPIVWGGWHPTLLPEETLRESFIDFVVVGQGERPLRGLVTHLRDGRDFTAIPSLGFKQGGTITVNPPAPADDTDSFPRIDLSLLDLKKNVNKSRLPEKFMDILQVTGALSIVLSAASGRFITAAGTVSRLNRLWKNCDTLRRKSVSTAFCLKTAISS